MLDAQFSNDALTRLHETMASYVTAGERPGLVTLLSRNGETHVRSDRHPRIWRWASDTTRYDFSNDLHHHTNHGCGEISPTVCCLLASEGLGFSAEWDRLWP